MLVAAVKNGAIWSIESFSQIDPYRLDQKTWTEAEALAAGLYSDDIKPFTQKPTLADGEKLDGGEVVDGRVVWSIVSKTPEEIAGEVLEEAIVKFGGIQCGNKGHCMIIPILDELLTTGTININNLPEETVTWYNDMKTLKVQIGDG